MSLWHDELRGGGYERKQTILKDGRKDGEVGEETERGQKKRERG